MLPQSQFNQFDQGSPKEESNVENGDPQDDLTRKPTNGGLLDDDNDPRNRQIYSPEPRSTRAYNEPQAKSEGHLNGQTVQNLYESILINITKNEIQLSVGTRNLLEKTCELWITEPPLLRGNLVENEAFLVALGELIVAKALNDPHVSQYKGKAKPVPFTDMFYSLAIAGKTVIGDLVHKGFT